MSNPARSPKHGLPFSALRKAWHRYLLDYPGQLILSLSGIALGIAVVVSIDLAKQSALTAFVQATETISGKAAYRIVGNSGALDENLYPKLRLGNLPFDFFAKIEGYVKIDRRDGEKLRLLGVDPFAESGFGSIGSLKSDSLSENDLRKMTRILTRPDYVLISRSTALRLNLEQSDSLPILSNGCKKRLDIAAMPEFSDPLRQQAMEDLILTDIASAQEILELTGRISHIDVVARGDDKPSALLSLEQQLPDNVELIAYQRINQDARDLTASFYTNLTALSLLSVMVGMFLIYNTINFLTIRRRKLIGMLRALGTSRAQIFQLVIGESALLGLIGTLTGLLLGSLLAYGLLDLIGNTINNVYFSLPTPRLRFSALVFVKGLCLGTAVSVLSAIPPARDAMRIEPFHAMTRSRLESNTRRRALKSTLFGLAALLAGMITTLLSGKNVAYGFAGLMLLVFGCALLTPFFLVGLSRVVYPIVHSIFGLLGALPLRSLNANLSRSGLAVAALMVAISATIGVQIMVTSFRSSVGEWLEQRLSADLYISAVTSQTLNNAPLNQAYLAKISKLEGIRSIGNVRRRSLQGAEGVNQLNVYALTPEVPDTFDFISGPADDHLWKDFGAKDTVIVTESYAYHHELKKGSMLELKSDRGPKEFLVIGIYRDYNPGPGAVTMSRATYARHWKDDGYSAMSVYTQPGTDLKKLQRDLHALSNTGQVLEITERSSILKASIAVFDQAFAVTDILQWLAATIAFLGVFSVLTAIQLDRIREYGVLRALGVTSKQLAILIAAESGLMGTIAGLLAIPVGIMTALVLVYVINQRSFGWSIMFHIAPETIIQGLLSGIIAAILAGLTPAYRMARLLPGEALRNE
ncbi:MAG: FtsX-like permease family protein [Methylococcales bacterium]